MQLLAKFIQTLNAHGASNMSKIRGRKRAIESSAAMFASAVTKEDSKLIEEQEALRHLNAVKSVDHQIQEKLLRTHFGDMFVKPIVWTLASGETRQFSEIDIPFEELESKTTVTFEINGREQSLLNKSTLSDLDSMIYQQHYPAIGYVNDDGVIDFVDGSRRRMRVIVSNGEIKSLRALVTNQPISKADAQTLAKSLQTAREHNLWELGKAASIHVDNGLKQADIATLMGLSVTKVNRALKAYSVDPSIIALFPNVGELSITDYNSLIKAQDKANENKVLSEEVLAVEILLEDSPDDVTSLILNHFKSYLSAQKPKSTSAIFTNLTKFDDKMKFARKKNDTNKRVVTYEFKRMSSEFQKKLDDFLINELKNEN